jgi:hypothetical protein
MVMLRIPLYSGFIEDVSLGFCGIAYAEDDFSPEMNKDKQRFYVCPVGYLRPSPFIPGKLMLYPT